MFNELIAHFLFRCEDCESILSLDIEEPEDLEKVRDNKMVVECPCGGKCYVLRD